MKWLSVKLEKVAGIQGGFAFKSADFTNEGIPLIRIGDIDEQIISIEKAARLPFEFLKKYSNLQLYPGDLLIALTGATTGKTGIVTSGQTPCLLNQRVGRFYLKNPNVICYNWIKYWIRTVNIQNTIWELAHGGAQPNISPNQIEDIEIFLPVPSEQRRIVEILDQADALRRMRAEADAKCDRILPALFIQMFGDPATNPMGWVEKKLSDLDIDFRYGTSAKCDSIIHGLPVLRIPNIIGGEINLNVLKYGELSSEETNRLLLQKGDLLFVRTNGNPDYVGRCAVFDLDEPYLFASYLIRARFPRDTVESRFIAGYLQTPSGRQGMLPFIRTTAGQSNISVEGLKNIPIFLPDIELQRNFVNQLDNLYKLRRQREHSKSMLKSTFQILLSRAFSGELTAKWREAHMKQLLAEMEEQAKALNLRDKGNYQQLTMLENSY